MPSLDYAMAVRFAEAIPKGRWSSYKDVATAAGNSEAFMAIGNWLRDSGGSIPNYWRVLRSDGRVADGFVAHLAGRPSDYTTARDLLRSEGIRFDPNGCASQGQRFRYSDWDRTRTLRTPERVAEAEAAAKARDESIVSEVSARRVAKGKPPLTAEQAAAMLRDLASKRSADGSTDALTRRL
jgi:alkylated DNA nucleotide flippase Atl1